MNMQRAKFGSKAFLRGFVEGFAPINFNCHAIHYRRTLDIDASAEAAWKEVGEALKSALESQGADIEQATGQKALSRARRARRQRTRGRDRTPA